MRFRLTNLSSASSSLGSSKADARGRSLERAYGRLQRKGTWQEHGSGARYAGSLIATMRLGNES